MSSQLGPSLEWVQSAKDNPNKLSFLDLPRELRDDVISYAFRVQGAIFMYSPNPYNNRRLTYKARVVRHGNKGPIEPLHLGRLIPLPLMFTCRQMHAECSPVLYRDNVYRVGPLNPLETSLVYRQLIKHVVYMADADPRLYGAHLDEVNYAWKRRFWPSVVSGGAKTLEQYPNIETLTVMLTSPGGQMWRPAFFAVDNKTKQQRIALAVGWMHPRCPLNNERLRACLRLELNPSARFFRDEYKGSRFAPEESDDEEWACAEFAEAFRVVMSLS
ncbi:hypothetical protein IQ06DRAFT_69387 [Phaeosphaeriaceae sp. SRC1lsM3a]|nr:hypothetical protein IQ06DRAFT_69387 [Stagonospora sp. SRC1lsM3a]